MSNLISEPARHTPVAANVDVCVIGGSCTGVFAAVQAARQGARVALVENQGFFGGTATAALVNIWHTHLDGEGRQPIIGGLTMDMVRRLEPRGQVRNLGFSPSHHYVLSSAALTLELDNLVREHAGIRPFLHARLVAAVTDNGRVSAAIIEDKSGRRAITARVFIDASGDGDLLERAGLPCRKLNDLQPPTTCAIIAGLEDIARANPGFNLEEAIFEPRHADKRLPRGFLWTSEAVGVPGARLVAGTRVPAADCSDADQLTHAEMEGRRQVAAILEVLRGYRGGETVSLVQVPAQIGIRETRHAECLHSLTAQQLLAGTPFDDAIANGSYRVDVHHSDRPGLTFRYLDGTQVYVAPGGVREEGRWREPTATNPTFYQIPYRCLTPRGSQNVLVAGRLIDADRGAYGAVRVMVNCNQTGEAAGVAAALAARSGCDVSGVDVPAVRAALAEQGSIML